MYKIIESDDMNLVFDGESLRLYKVPRGEQEAILNEIDSCCCQENIDTNLERLERLVICVSSACNLACKYCYEGDENTCNQITKINNETIANAIDFIYKLYPLGIHCIQFFGGEPLLNVEGIKFSIEYVNNLCSLNNIKSPFYTIVTNGTLITPEVHDMFNQFFNRITISLDGDKEVNDLNRIFRKDNKSVFEKVSENIRWMNEARKYCIDIQMTVTQAQLDKSGIQDYLTIKDLGVDSIHVTPVINTEGFSIEKKEEYINRTIDYFTKCYELEMANLSKSNYFRVLGLVNTIKNKSGSEYYCGAGFLNLSIDVNGNVYPCFMFNGNDKFVMGNVNTEMTDFLKNREFYLDNKTRKNQKCQNCWARRICASGHSGCIGSFYYENQDIKKPVEANCRLTKAMVELVLKKMMSYV